MLLQFFFLKKPFQKGPLYLGRMVQTGKSHCAGPADQGAERGWVSVYKPDNPDTK